MRQYGARKANFKSRSLSSKERVRRPQQVRTRTEPEIEVDYPGWKGDRLWAIWSDSDSSLWEDTNHHPLVFRSEQDAFDYMTQKLPGEEEEDYSSNVSRPFANPPKKAKDQIWSVIPVNILEKSQPT